MSVEFDERVEVREKIHPPKKFNIWTMNNDLTSFDEVVMILVKGAGLSESEAAALTIKVDTEGKAKVNKKPVSKNVAMALYKRLNDTKRAVSLIREVQYGRGRAVMELKFVVKED